MVAKTIKVLDNIDLMEFYKIIGFVSEKIAGVQVNGTEVEVLFDNDTSEDEILSILTNIYDLSKKYVVTSDSSNSIMFETQKNNFYTGEDEACGICTMENGMIILSGLALEIYKFFELEFANIAKEIGAIEKRYPVLLPVDEYAKTGYLSNSPQYAIFCSDAKENIKDLSNVQKAIDSEQLDMYISYPRYALSPSACFHVYSELKNKTIKSKSVYSFTQSVFRNEGRFNFTDFGRLRDYHVREIVFIGDQQFVEQQRQLVMAKTKKLVERLKLKGDLVVASDPFVMPKMQKFKKIQKLEKSKYELRLNYSCEKQISVASFNIHGTAFTYPFNIKVMDVEDTVTGCVGYGIERWVLSFVRQYGGDRHNWPEYIRGKINKIIF